MKSLCGEIMYLDTVYNVCNIIHIDEEYMCLSKIIDIILKDESDGDCDL